MNGGHFKSKTAWRSAGLVIVGLGMLAGIVLALKLGLDWRFLDALVIPSFVLTAGVMGFQCWNRMFREQTTRDRVRGRWIFGVCAFVCIALGAIQSEPAAQLFFGQFAMINLCSFVKPPRSSDVVLGAIAPTVRGM